MSKMDWENATSDEKADKLNEFLKKFRDDVFADLNDIKNRLKIMEEDLKKSNQS